MSASGPHPWRSSPQPGGRDRRRNACSPRPRIALPAPGAWLACATVLVVGACTTSSPDPASSTPDAPPTRSIADARALPGGSATVIEGHVTVAPGALASATGEHGFAIQDETGGIYVTMPARTRLAPSQRVRVSGMLAQANRQTVLMASLATVTPLDASGTITPRSASTGDVDEALEGLLIQVSGTITQAAVDEAPHGQSLYLDDGSGELRILVHLVDAAPVIDTASLRPGHDVTVTGLAMHYLDRYEVAPRGPDDLVRNPAG